MVSKAIMFNLFLTFASLQLGSAARIKRSADSLNSTNDSMGGSVCSISEMEGHIKYGVTFNFKQKKCSRVSCNVFDFLAETVVEMMKAEPEYKGEEGICGCHVKEGPSADSPVQQFLFKFKQFKKKGLKGQYIYDCTSKMCWNRYGQIVSLGKRAERGSIDWPRTEDFESRNHYQASCIEATASTISEVAASSLPTVHTIIKKLKEEGKADGVAEILEIVEDEPDNAEDQPVTSDTVGKKFPIFLTEVDDGNEESHLHNMVFVDTYTDLKDVVVLSNAHGVCSKSAAQYTSSKDAKCGLIKTSADCKLAAELLKRNLGTGEGLSDVFNDMSPPEDEAVQFYANEFKMKALKRYPPACFGRITGVGGDMHTHWNPLLDLSEKRAKGTKGQVMERLICGCYGEA